MSTKCVAVVATATAIQPESLARAVEAHDGPGTEHDGPCRRLTRAAIGPANFAFVGDLDYHPENLAAGHGWGALQPDRKNGRSWAVKRGACVVISLVSFIQ